MSKHHYQNRPFNPVTFGTKAVTQVDKYLKTLLGVEVTMGGGMTKANTSEISVLLGSRTIVGPITGTELDEINTYNGMPVDSSRLSIDLTERDMSSRNYNKQIAVELGGIDMPSIGGDEIYVEWTNSMGSGSPTLNSRLVLGDLQTAKENRDPNSQAIKKIKTTTLPSTGSVDVIWTPQLRGAQLLRAHFKTATPGNIKWLTVEKNNIPLHQKVVAADNAYYQLKNKKVPQANYYHYDPVFDNLMESWVDTFDALSLKFTMELTTVEPVRVVYEVIDLPYNL